MPEKGQQPKSKTPVTGRGSHPNLNPEKPELKSILDAPSGLNKPQTNKETSGEVLKRGIINLLFGDPYDPRNRRKD